MSKFDKTPQRAVMQFCFELGKSPAETVDLINRTNSVEKVNRRLVYRWFDRFRDGDVSYKDQDRTGRPKDARLAENIQLVSDVMDEDRRVSIRSLCERLNLSYGTVQRIVTDDLHMKRLCARWVPRLLKEEEMTVRVRESERFLRRWKKEGDDFLKRIITVDETWVYHFDPESKMQSSQWKNTDQLKRACNEIFTALPREWFADVFRRWVDRHQRCIEHQGRYFEKE